MPRTKSDPPLAVIPKKPPTIPRDHDGENPNLPISIALTAPNRNRFSIGDEVVDCAFGSPYRGIVVGFDAGTQVRVRWPTRIDQHHHEELINITPGRSEWAFAGNVGPGQKPDDLPAKGGLDTWGVTGLTAGKRKKANTAMTGTMNPVLDSVVVHRLSELGVSHDDVLYLARTFTKIRGGAVGQTPETEIQRDPASHWFEDNSSAARRVRALDPSDVTDMPDVKAMRGYGDIMHESDDESPVMPVTSNRRSRNRKAAGWVNPLADPIVVQALIKRGMHVQDVRQLAKTYAAYSDQAHANNPNGVSGQRMVQQQNRPVAIQNQIMQRQNGAGTMFPGEPATQAQPSGTYPLDNGHGTYPMENSPETYPLAHQFQMASRYRRAGREQLEKIANRLGAGGQKRLALDLGTVIAASRALGTLHDDAATRTKATDRTARRALRQVTRKALRVANAFRRNPETVSLASRIDLATYHSFLFPRD